MRNTGGTDFDPVCVDVFLNAFNRNEMEVPEVLVQCLRSGLVRHELPRQEHEQ
jgi:HD-GYP domain-containing protein (c-di-GMP phosphodiesterase class II)